MTGPTAAAALCLTAATAILLSSPPASAAEVTTVTIDGTHTLKTLSPDFLGLSFEASILASGRTTGARGNLSALLAQLSSQGHLRFGGNLMDADTWWQPGGKPVPSYAKAVLTRPDIDRLDGLARASGWSVELGANLKHLDTASVSDEAAYASSVLGPRLLAMACGNEPDLYPGYAYPTYHASWRECADAIGVRARLVGPNWAGTIPAQFLTDEGGRLAFGAAHYYPLTLCNGGTPTLTDLLSARTVGAESVKFGDDVAITGAHGRAFRMDETNSVSCGGAGQVSNVYGSALWGIDYLLLGAQMGVAGMNFHGGLDICATNYSALCAANQTDLDAGIYSAGPLYYGMLMASRLGAGAFLPVGVDTPRVRAYAVRGTDSIVRIMLVQKDSVGGSPVDVRVAGFGGAGTASAITMTGSSLSGPASGIHVQGAQVGPDGRISVPPGTAVPGSDGVFRLSVPTGSAVVLTLPAGAAAEPVPSVGQDLVGAGSGRCLDVSGFRTTDYVPVQLYGCANTWNQKWQYTGGSLVNPFTHRCLDVSGGRVADGTPVQLWSCLGNPAQQWTLRSDGTVVNPSSGKCLDAVGRGTGDGTRLQIWSCGTSDNANQRWALR